MTPEAPPTHHASFLAFLHTHAPPRPLRILPAQLTLVCASCTRISPVMWPRWAGCVINMCVSWKHIPFVSPHHKLNNPWALMIPLAPVIWYYKGWEGRGDEGVDARVVCGWPQQTQILISWPAASPRLHRETGEGCAHTPRHFSYSAHTILKNHRQKTCFYLKLSQIFLDYPFPFSSTIYESYSLSKQWSGLEKHRQFALMKE